MKTRCATTTGSRVSSPERRYCGELSISQRVHPRCATNPRRSGAKKGKRLKLAAWVYATFPENLADGMRRGTRMEQGWLDGVIVHWNPPEAQLIAAAKARKCQCVFNPVGGEAAIAKQCGAGYDLAVDGFAFWDIDLSQDSPTCVAGSPQGRASQGNRAVRPKRARTAQYSAEDGRRLRCNARSSATCLDTGSQTARHGRAPTSWRRAATLIWLHRETEVNGRHLKHNDLPLARDADNSRTLPARSVTTRHPWCMRRCRGR